MNHHFESLALFLIIGALCTILPDPISAQEGPAVGTIGEVKHAAKEIIVQSPKAAQLIKIGDRLYVRVDGKAVVLRATFPMQTVAKCALEGKYVGYLGKLSKGMPVYQYVKGVEEGEESIDTGPAVGAVKKVGGIDFVFIKGGEYMMGSPEGVGDFFERPQHKVTVNPFWMSKYEVTQSQYQEIMGMNPSNFKGAKLPVEQVNWNDAKNFCQQFSVKYNVKARLPYEAEWEYACRAGSKTKYYWGDSLSGKYCWYSGNSGNKTNSVGGKLPNAWGLYDMNGNVSEWCEDWYGVKYYSISPEMNPQGPTSGESRVFRGGHWDSYDLDICSATRRGTNPESGLTGIIGIRLVIDGL